MSSAGWVLSRLNAADAASSEENEDRDMVAQSRQGNREAFDRLIGKYQSRVYRFCYRIVGDEGEAEDLVQEVFLQIHGHLSEFRNEAKFSTWLYQIAKNQSLNRLKYLKRRRHYTLQSLDQPQSGDDERGPVQIADESQDALGQFEGRELHAMLHAKIRAMRPEYRVVLILRDIEGLRYDEIAEIMELSEGTVKSRIHRARMDLKVTLDGFFH